MRSTATGRDLLAAEVDLPVAEGDLTTAGGELTDTEGELSLKESLDLPKKKSLPLKESSISAEEKLRHHCHRSTQLLSTEC